MTLLKWLVGALIAFLVCYFVALTAQFAGVLLSGVYR